MRLSALGQRGLEAFDDAIAVAGLGEETDGAAGKRLLPDAILRERGDEDDRHLPALMGEGPLQIDSVHAGHLDVQDEAIGEVDLRRIEKRLGRCKGGRSISKRAQQRPGSRANGSIVIDNGHDGNGRNGRHWQDLGSGSARDHYTQVYFLRVMGLVRSASTIRTGLAKERAHAYLIRRRIERAHRLLLPPEKRPALGDAAHSGRTGTPTR